MIENVFFVFEPAKQLNIWWLSPKQWMLSSTVIKQTTEKGLNSISVKPDQ